MNELGDYDWDMHATLYDVEIGKKDENNNIVFYDGLSEDDIEQKYPFLNYEILLVDKEYASVHSNKKEGYIYAICTEPVLNELDFKNNNFVVPAVPMLVEFENNKVINYYFDDKKIIDFLRLNKAPTNIYWNLEE